MVSSVRYRPITNATGAVVVAGAAKIGYGQDFSMETVERTLAVIDVGNNAGKTQHAQGMIFAEFSGAVIKNVVSVEVFRTANGFDYEWLGTDAATLKIGYSITNAGGVSTLRLQDSSTAAAFVASGDRVVVTVLLGSSNS